MKKLSLFWKGKVWYWGINANTLLPSGCRYKMDDKEYFDIHVESPTYDITNNRDVSLMINVRGNQPLGAKEAFSDLNLSPIYEKLRDMPFNPLDKVIIETSDYTEWKMHDCVWIHHYKRDDDIQIVPNSIDNIIIVKKASILDYFLAFVFDLYNHFANP